MTAPIRIADLEKPAGKVELLSGRVVSVRHMDAIAVDLYKTILTDPSQGELVWPLARRILPDATEDEINALTPEAISAVAQIALDQLAAVQAWIADLTARKEPTPAPTASSSSPATESGTSSPLSDAPSADSRASSPESHSTSSSGTTSS